MKFPILPPPVDLYCPNEQFLDDSLEPFGLANWTASLRVITDIHVGKRQASDRPDRKVAKSAEVTANLQSVGVVSSRF